VNGAGESEWERERLCIQRNIRLKLRESIESTLSSIRASKLLHLPPSKCADFSLVKELKTVSPFLD